MVCTIFSLLDSKYSVHKSSTINVDKVANLGENGNGLLDAEMRI